MFSRRTFLSFVAGSMAAPRLASAQPPSSKVALYANVGADLTHYDVDVAGAELIKRETVALPAAVQYAWPHASRRYLYVASSSSAPGYGTQGTEHHVTAFAIDPSSGAQHRTGHRYDCRPVRFTSARTFHPNTFWLPSTIRAQCAFTGSILISPLVTR